MPLPPPARPGQGLCRRLGFHVSRAEALLAAQQQRTRPQGPLSRFRSVGNCVASSDVATECSLWRKFWTQQFDATELPRGRATKLEYEARCLPVNKLTVSALPRATPKRSAQRSGRLKSLRSCSSNVSADEAKDFVNRRSPNCNTKPRSHGHRTASSGTLLRCRED